MTMSDAVVQGVAHLEVRSSAHAVTSDVLHAPICGWSCGGRLHEIMLLHECLGVGQQHIQIEYNNDENKTRQRRSKGERKNICIKKKCKKARKHENQQMVICSPRV